jgi:hypothetical protein
VFQEKSITEWTTRACALVDGVTADYIAIHVRAGAKSWPEHATVRVEGRAPADVADEVIGHVRDIGESAGAEGRGAAAVRLKVYRAKMPAGSRTFSSLGSHPPGSDPVRDDDDDTSPRGELAATVRELRHLVVAMGADLATQATHGWQLAIRQQEQIASLTARNAHLEAVVKLGDAAGSDPMREALAGLLPQLPMILASLPAVAAARQAAAFSPATE